MRVKWAYSCHASYVGVFRLFGLLVVTSKTVIKSKIISNQGQFGICHWEKVLNHTMISVFILL